jgi:hypothetical protein
VNLTGARNAWHASGRSTRPTTHSNNSRMPALRPHSIPNQPTPQATAVIAQVTRNELNTVAGIAASDFMTQNVRVERGLRFPPATAPRYSVYHGHKRYTYAHEH